MCRDKLHLVIVTVFFTILGFSFVLSGCEEILDGEAAELKEPELPNCSRIITCCNNLEGNGLAPSECQEIFVPAADAVIENYQTVRDNIPFNDAQARELLLDETQSRVEPGCRCFLEETIGQLGDFILPIDCESDKEVGTLEGGKEGRLVDSAEVGHEPALGGEALGGRGRLEGGDGGRQIAERSGRSRNEQPGEQEAVEHQALASAPSSRTARA